MTARFAIGLQDVQKARQTIGGAVPETPLVRLEAASRRLGREIVCKLETVLPTRSFKLRGAANFLLSQREAAIARGVVTFSTGNHGRAVARIGGLIGAPVTVCLGSLVPENKQQALSESGARLVRVEGGQDRAEETARRMAADSGLLLVSAMSDPFVMAGQGTIGLELHDRLDSIGTVVVPLSGGGLASGILIALKALSPATRIVGVTMEQGAAMHASLAAGRPVEVTEYPTLADSLGGGVGGPDSLTFPIVQALIDEAVLVSEAEIGHAMAFALLREGLVLEGAAAAALAYALRPAAANLTGPIVLIGSGANVSADSLLDVTQQHRSEALAR